MKNKHLLVGLIFVLTRFASEAQTDFLPGEIYFKLADNFQITLDQYPGDSANVPVQMPFFASFVNTFQVSSVKRVFYFTSDNKLIRTFRVRCADAVNLDNFVAELDAQPEVDYAEKIGVNLTDIVPNDLYGNSATGQWSLHKILAQSAWNLSVGNSNVKVAIVDNAFEIAHPDLMNVVVQGWDVSDNDNDPSCISTAFSHGTHVAGIAGAETNNGPFSWSVASIGFGIAIMPVKVTPDNGNPNGIYHGYQGIAWAAANGADIINCSWGGGFGGTTGLNAVNYAWNQGAVVVAAAGNSNSSGLFYPAAFPNVLSVGSTDIGDQKSAFSNWGATVDVCAPGESILSLVPFGSRAIYSGTSMAAPLVSGLLGLMLSANPSLDNQALANCLVSTADNIDLQNPTWIGQLGSGRINALRALLCAKSPSPCPPDWTFASTSNDFNNVNHYYEASQWIVASNKVIGTSTITYDAGDFVKLTAHPTSPNSDGFKAQTSGFFKALIDGCVETPPCAPAPPGMIAWWPMDDQAGDPFVVDIVGGHHGTPLPGGSVGFSGPTPVSGKVSGALQFTGNPPSRYVQAFGGPAFAIGAGDFSIDAWINTPGGTQTEPIIASNAGWDFSVSGPTSTGMLYVTLALGSIGVQGPAIVKGDWNFVAVTVNPQAATFYVGNSINGVPQFTQSTVPIAGTYSFSGGILNIGYNNFNPHWTIAIDELEIFNRELSSSEIMSIWSADSLGKCKTFVSAINSPTTVPLRIFPNPNSGSFTIELPEPATLGMMFRVVDLAGRLLLEQQIEPGSALQTVQADDLPSGLYFLQVVSEGKVLAVEKFVKQ